MAETTALTTTTLKSLFERNKDQLAVALPKYMDVDRLIRIAVTCCQRTPALLECHPITMLGALFGCAQLGIEPDPVTGEAYLVPFNNKKKNRKEVQLIVGYRGLIKLVTNTEQVSMIYAKEVCQNDEFNCEFGSHPVLHHKIIKQTMKERGPITHFYAVAKLSNGETQFEVMTKEDVDAIRARSMAKNDGPWVTDYVEMGRKTPTRRLCKYLPKAPTSSKLLLAIGLDERHDSGKPQDLGLFTKDSIETATPDAPEPAPAPSMPKELKDSSPKNDTPHSQSSGTVDPGTAIEPN